ncbi:MAG: dihydrolipoyl dehydrogenase [Alphaproteobacteria bacterium]|uniref:Dihydrolipoyl dehydrogenase n=1 Tax=Candidatus Nitrobium versatile TaxID=2884831 RepID=A0A953M0N4_9BACT|nr:dihydrolipoyl dehydrogenase [Candidatus Nitrobium versatile]
MKEYETIVIGGGTAGLTVLFKALSQKGKVALIEKNLLGGTCQNFGCVPSKMLLYPADLVTLIQRAGRFGIQAEVSRIDFSAVMERMRKYVADIRKGTEEGVTGSENLDYYHQQAHFVDEYTLETGNERIRGKRIFIATGSREMIPPVKGLDAAGYLTSETLLQMTEKPESMLIIGGGYVAAEYSHFFASMGTRVIVLQNGERLVPHEEPEISDLLRQEMEKRMEVYTGITATGVKKDKNGGYTVTGKEDKTGEAKDFTAEKVLVATGRESNADMLKGENTGITLTGKGYIKVNDYLETEKKEIWAVGDAIDRLMFTHSGDKEAEIAWYNATNDRKVKMDFSLVPHAVYSYPQIASVGLTEEQARKEHTILVGKARYSDIVKGNAMEEETGFAKAIVEKGSGRILGFHLIGPEAPLLIQEVVTAMTAGLTSTALTESMHIFPSLSEVVQEALGHAREP